MGTKKCQKIKATHDKHQKKSLTSIKNFFQPGPITLALVPSTVTPTPQPSIAKHHDATESTLQSTTAGSQGMTLPVPEFPVSPVAENTATPINFLEKLHHLIAEGFDEPSLDTDELWETVLNQVLKSALGWGKEGDMDTVIRQGKKGLDGLANFVRHYIIKRGVSEGLFEGKSAKQAQLPSSEEIEDIPAPALHMELGQGIDGQAIDVDAFEYEDIIQKEAPAIKASAAQGFYHPKSFTEEEDMQAILFWRLAGNRLAEINHNSTGAPSVSYLRTCSTVPPIVSLPGIPTIEEVRKNAESVLQSVLGVLHERMGGGKNLHAVLMFDEIATEKRIRWDQLTNMFLGICQQHTYKICLEFINEDDMVQLFHAIDKQEVLCAGEAMVAALVSGDCKQETGEEHATVIETVMSGLHSIQDKTKIRIVSLASDGETRPDHIGAIFNPEDQQDVKMAFNMLKDIWTLPRTSDGSNPGFLSAREALWILGKLLYHMVFPYLCVDLSLSEQIEHLSAAAHIAIALYYQIGKDFIPTGLYIDLMIMIKNVVFCVAKMKVNNPNGEFFIILLGTDRLEELFGILRTMVGNDANLDLLQLGNRLSGTTEIANILAKYPHWDHAPQRLKLPALSCDSKELHDRSDHIKPASWRGNDKADNHDANATAMENTLSAANMRIEVEEALGELVPDTPAMVDTPRVVVKTQVLIGGTLISKAHALSRFSKYRTTASSTDCLRRVQAIERYIQNPSISIHNSEKSGPEATTDNTQMLMVSDPITTILSSESKLWLCIGEVNSLKIDGKSVDFVDFDMLAEGTVLVSYQMIGLRPAMANEDTSLKYDWEMYWMPERSFTVPGALIGPVNPALSTTHTDIPWYMFQSSVLVALVASLMQDLSVSQLKSIPKYAPSSDFPYREASGHACFLGDDSTELLSSGTSQCPRCTPTVDLDLSQGQLKCSKKTKKILLVVSEVHRAWIPSSTQMSSNVALQASGADLNPSSDSDSNSGPRGILAWAYDSEAASSDDNGGGVLLLTGDSMIRGVCGGKDNADERSKEAASVDEDSAVHSVDSIRNSAGSEITTMGANIQVAPHPDYDSAIIAHSISLSTETLHTVDCHDAAADI
ncbi:hypothetical protein HYPSUDRAFT_53262 [Hypholoma sublateritium FD-334 SS-4]|uniref:Uncharacterized protein n=1 Tax=Hypholoma sublateritium (strain FD-334 SS-4) TaxID=945553 RepID=A0A0D2P9U4_HYPSF|nr:hypothetical protein HYPSUDRAFT_53262 [Hypholoma sublateritium FD-334 SS-4]